MSNNVLPSEIFLKLLPVKSLIRFRSVSKTWKSLIDSRDFVIKHHTHHSQSRQQLLVAYENQVPVSDDDDDWDYEQKYVSVVDDNAFPKHNVVLTPPLLVRMLTRPRLIATSHVKDIYATAIGFGVCRETNDVKIVKITYVDQKTHGPTCILPHVKVVTLRTRTRAWRSPYGNLLGKSIHFFSDHEVLVDGVFYWLATDRITLNKCAYEYMVISFDMTSEEFREITLPPSLVSASRMVLALSKLGESLVVVGHDQLAIDPSFDVWVMEDGSFTKLFAFTPKDDDLFRGFRKTGEPILGNLEIDGYRGRFKVCDYMETLLLHDHPNFMG
ncbi:putative F-box protein At5g62060 [Bidens hawaiensis]|uniref:putative F-box protein At5g62060 n=1 Tax=Bidens hawaiensis TaxID=980011 RepID=UPI00404995B4